MLEALALCLLGGEPALERQGLDGAERLLEQLEAVGADADLGGPVVLGDLAVSGEWTNRAVEPLWLPRSRAPPVPAVWMT